MYGRGFKGLIRHSKEAATQLCFSFSASYFTARYDYEKGLVVIGKDKNSVCEKPDRLPVFQVHIALFAYSYKGNSSTG